MPWSKLNLDLNPSFLILLISGTLMLVPPLRKGVFLILIFFFKIFDNLYAKFLIFILSLVPIL